MLTYIGNVAFNFFSKCRFRNEFYLATQIQAQVKWLKMGTCVVIDRMLGKTSDSLFGHRDLFCLQPSPPQYLREGVALLQVSQSTEQGCLEFLLAPMLKCKHAGRLASPSEHLVFQSGPWL